MTEDEKLDRVARECREAFYGGSRHAQLDYNLLSELVRDQWRRVARAAQRALALTSGRTP